MGHIPHNSCNAQRTVLSTAVRPLPTASCSQFAMPAQQQADDDEEEEGVYVEPGRIGGAAEAAGAGSGGHGEHVAAEKAVLVSKVGAATHPRSLAPQGGGVLVQGGAGGGRAAVYVAGEAWHAHPTFLGPRTPYQPDSTEGRAPHDTDVNGTGACCLQL